MFLSIIPSIRMPYGHDFFDYRVESGTAHIGDLILIPFRRQQIAGLVARISPTSIYGDRAILLESPKKLAKLPELTADLCRNAARECFVSPPTMLHAWLRTIPKRAPIDETHTLVRDTHWPAGRSRNETRYVVNRMADPSGILSAIEQEQSNGRILVLTPWQRRADYLTSRLGCGGLHAHTAAGAAWRAWTGFNAQTHGILVATRVGAWLASCADVVIIDEPENDDHKQDELSPRYDARRIVKLTSELNPALRSISIGTTPPLTEAKVSAPQINVEILIERFGPGARSKTEALNAGTVNAIAEALEAKRPVRILHPVFGERGRVRCADCSWTMACQSCGSGMSNNRTEALCRRCGAQAMMPFSCPTCGGSNLSRSAIGAQALGRVLATAFPSADLQVYDLPQWQEQPVTPRSLVVVTNLSLIGGFTEDIRRKERLVIAFRRLTAQISASRCSLVIQAAASLADECTSWLAPSGVNLAWENEMKDRLAFGFPPARPVVKFIMTGKKESALLLDQTLKTVCNTADGWSVRGPFTVENRSQTRQPREIFHILPPPNMTRDQTIDALSPLAKLGILDLDPVAFFS